MPATVFALAVPNAPDVVDLTAAMRKLGVRTQPELAKKLRALRALGADIGDGAA